MGAVFLEKIRGEVFTFFMGADCPGFTPQPKLPPVHGCQVTLGQHLVAVPVLGCASVCPAAASHCPCVARYALVTPQTYRAVAVCSAVVAVCPLPHTLPIKLL